MCLLFRAVLEVWWILHCDQDILCVSLIYLGFVCLFCFLRQGSLCIALTVPGTHYIDRAGLELTEIHLPLPSEYGTKGMCHYAQQFIYLIILFIYFRQGLPVYSWLAWDSLH